MIWSYLPVLLVEIDRIAAVDIHRAKRNPHALAVDEIKVDEFLQRVSKRCGVVDGERLRRPVRSEERRWNARDEKAGDAERRSRRGTHPVKDEPQRIKEFRDGQRNAG